MANPLGQLREFKRRGRKVWLPVWKDINGDPITSSNGLVPVKQAWELVSIAVIHGVIYKPSHTDADHYAQFNALNSIPWRSFPQYHAWVAECNTDERTLANDAGAAQGGTEVHYVIWGTDRDGGWRFTSPDVAYAYKDGTNFKSFTAGGGPYLGNLTNTGEKGTSLLMKYHDTKKQINFASVLGF